MLSSVPAAHPTAPPACAPPARRRRSRAKPRPPRPRTVVMSELRGLGGVVLEQALLDGEAAPAPSVVEWCRRLARELGLGDPGSPRTYREMMAAVLNLHRAALADPERPIVALPRAS